MNSKYFIIFIIVCLTISATIVCTGCIEQKHTANVIKYESKYKKYINKKAKTTSVIDLSDGVPVNYNYSVGPQELSDPSFKIITVDTMP